MKDFFGYLLHVSIVLVFFSCKSDHIKETTHSQSMPAILQKAAKDYFFVPENVYASTLRIDYFDSLLSISSPFHKNKFLLEKAETSLLAGQTQTAIILLKELKAIKAKSVFMVGLEAYEEKKIDALFAFAYLRLGEQENCLMNHSSSSCLIPIQQAGFHQLPEGSSQAIKLYSDILSTNPKDLESRWLLNIAYMTLGEYPEKVPEQWLIPEKAFASEFPLKKFQDIATEAGLAVNALSGGGIVDDFNNDGFLDIMVSSWFPNHPIKYFINVGDGTFQDSSESCGLDGIGGGLNMVQTDYNNDGYLDVFVLRGAWMGELGKHPNSLLRNNGDNTFTDVTIETGLLSYHPTQTATWADFNNDGFVDLFIGNESTGKGNFHPCELFINQNGKSFLNMAFEANLEVNTPENPYYIKGVTAGDFDNDGWQDIFISTVNANSRSFLFKNTGNISENGAPVFLDMTEKAGLGDPFSSFPTWFWDYNNDGYLDIFAAGYLRTEYFSSVTKDIASEYLGIPHQAETARLFKNNGDGTFSDVSEEANLNRILYGMGANFGDLDNDGFLDMYISTGEVNITSIIPNRMFRNNVGENFQDVTSAGGFGNIQKGHAVSFADLDNDGDQ
ncbi:MAG: VCBS repeat-containing protein, partial [Flammeovirgaceae bacterium]|nr:VCBS repeat-containing protein [Flammeovirgaceae bacterium]